MKIQVRTSRGDVSCDHQVGDTLLHTLQRHRIHLPAPCGGIGKCGKCRVEVDDEQAAGPRRPEEERHAPNGSGARLACCCSPVSPITVTLPSGIDISAAHSEAKGGAIEVPVEGLPVVRSVEIALEPPTLEDQRSVHRRLADQIDDDSVRISLSAVRDAAMLMEGMAEERVVAGLIVAGDARDLLVAVDDEVRDVLPGVAIDIGTTTIAAYLIDLAARRVLAIRSEANAQGRFGADVVSRIGAASQGKDLTAVVRGQLSEMIKALAAEAGVTGREVLTAAVVGNPTMIHLLMDLDPRSIGVSPFMPVTSESLEVTMASVDLPGHPEARVTVAPGLSAYVGADIVADLLASELTRSEGLSLLIDIGTNGEIVLGNSHHITACSTAAGPAFEGANIRHGSGGVAGAINSVQRVGDAIRVETIGDVEACSICGPGLIDLVAMLLDDGAVDETGRLDPDAVCKMPAYAQRLTEIDGEPAVVISEPGSPSEIVLTQGDIRQVQLAKGAIAAGVRTLLEVTDSSPADVEKVYLAGGFGTYLNPASATRVGLLPDIDPERVVGIGNAAGSGAARLILDKKSRAEAVAIAAEATYLELSRSDDFQRFFMDEMMFR